MSNSSQFVPKLCRTLLQENLVAITLHGFKEGTGKGKKKALRAVKHKDTDSGL